MAATSTYTPPIDLYNKAEVGSQKLTDLDGSGEGDMGGAMAEETDAGEVFSGMGSDKNIFLM